MTEIQVPTSFADLAKVPDTEENDTKLHSDTGKVKSKAEGEDEAGLALKVLSPNDERTPTLSDAAPRSGLTSTFSVTPLDELFPPTMKTPQPVEVERVDDRARDSTAEIDLGDIDESRFSTVALNVGVSRRSSVASHFDSKDQRSSTVSFILAKAQDTQFRHSLDGHRELQDEFEKAHANEGDADTAARGVDWEFWGAVMSDYQAYATENPEELARAIENGIPQALRGMVWQMMAASKDPTLEKLYLTLIRETSPHEKAIMRDLGRTFPHHTFFTAAEGLGQENLFNVLKAYSLYDPQVGYCQGLPFVVAILLLNMPDEEAFCLLVRLMYSYDLRGHFLPEMPRLQLRLYQFERLIEECLPVLHVHFLRQGVKSSMFASQWFLTCFSYRFPHDMVFRIFDNILAAGIEALFGFSLGMLQRNEEKLLAMKFDEMVVYLNNKIFDTYRREDGTYHVDSFVQDAVNLRVTPLMLDAIAAEYREAARIKEAHALEMDALRSSNRNLSAQVQNMEASLQQLNDEHRETLNQLVGARMRNDELETELVRYKLLYAEAMHQSEDARSSHRISLLSSKRGSAGS